MMYSGKLFQKPKCLPVSILLTNDCHDFIDFSLRSKFVLPVNFNTLSIFFNTR